MKIEWNRTSVLYIGISVLVCVLFVYLGKQWLVAPLEEEVQELERTLQSERKILSALEEKSEESRRDEILTSRTMQQQLPVIPLLDQMLIGLDRAENASTSLINRIGISDSESMIMKAEAGDELEKVDDAEDEVDQAGEAPVEDSEEAGEIIEGLHTLQFSIDMTSENFKEMMQFLNEIQSLPRVTQIESIQFDAPSDKNELNYTLLLNSYYQPLYSELANEAPQYHYGGSSEKVDPFTTEQLQEGEQTSEETDEELQDGDEAEQEDSEAQL